jgi:circadian clock protein KaiC
MTKTSSDAAHAADPLALPDKLNTGVPDFDDILHGGLPKGYLYLVEGHPGTGKTTLALQFLLAGIRNGERVLYVTLSESERELHGVIRSHGWSTDNLPICELTPPDEDLKPEAQYTVFHPSEVELADTVGTVFQHVEALKPHRLVIDSLSEVRMLSRDPLKYRRQILAIKRYLSGRDCTTLMLDDGTAENGHDLQLQSIAHGVVHLENLNRDYGVNRRRIQIGKVRGSAYREGFHDYTIEQGGVIIYPRLVAAEHRPGFERKSVPSGIKELDDLFRGGIDTGTSTLLMGPAGCGKSTIALRYAVSAAQRNEKAMIFAFDESPGTLVERARDLKMDPQPFIESGALEIQQVDPAELSPGQFVARVRRLVDEQNMRILVIDSMNGLLNAMPNEQFLTMQLHELFSYTAQQGIATILTLAQQGIIGSSMNAPIDISYLADTVLLFRYFEKAGQIRQALSVVKKRSGPHERAIRELISQEGSVYVGESLTNFEGSSLAYRDSSDRPSSAQTTETALESDVPQADHRTIILAPTGRDSELISELLERSALRCHIAGSVLELIRELEHGAGAAVISEEALVGDAIPVILRYLDEQPSWSDFPLIVLTVGGQVTAESERLRELRRPLDNVFLLERPIRPETLLGTLEIALRGRQRQYQIRDQMLQYERAQEALRRSEKLAVTGRLAASIAHEINNPLEAVTNLLYLMRTDPSHEKIQGYLLEAERELARVTEITTQTLRFYREPNKSIETELTNVLESVLVLYQSRLTAANIFVEQEIREPLLTVLSSPGELRQVIANIIGNSIDAMRRGGRLCIRISREKAAHGAPTVRLTIADTGSGIPAHLLPKVFEPFITTKGETGTGLGLWVTAEIVKKNGWKIQVRSSQRPGRSGTTFSLCMPLLV